MIFITLEHLRPYIKDERLAALINNETAILDQTELVALSMVRNYIHAKYDIDAMDLQSAVHDPKIQYFVRWVCVIMLYLLYERIPERLAPERVIKNYEEVVASLKDVQSGKTEAFGLPALAADMNQDGYPDTTKFRWGSKPARTH